MRSPLLIAVASVATLVAASAAHAQVFVPASPIPFSPYAGGLVRLSNGRALAVGGSPNQNGTALYDPAAKAWSSLARLANGRMSHTTTVLADGKVLVAGGGDDSLVGAGLGVTYFANAELYDPAANAWSPAGSLTTTRQFHAATLLQSGKVLISGGSTFGQCCLSGAELYDPVANSWAPAGSLTIGRFNHTSLLLPNGKVLIVAGQGAPQGGAVASTELYDPATNTWTLAAPLGAAQMGHTDTLLPNGKVLNVGVTTELYDPNANTWSPAASPHVGRSNHTATLLASGLVLIAGGISASDGYLTSAELYNPATNAWTLTASLTTPRAYHLATTVGNGDVLVADGYATSGAPSGTDEVYSAAAPAVPAVPRWGLVALAGALLSVTTVGTMRRRRHP